MKKGVLVCAAVIGAVMLAGCGQQEKTVEVTTVEEQTAVETEAPVAIEEEEEVTESNNVGEEIAEGDFSIVDLGDGTCEISYCYSESSVIEVPSTIYDKTVVGVGQFAFNQSDAVEIILPDTVEYIDSYAFSECENLESISFGQGLLRTGEMIFNDCNSLKQVTFPEGMTTMESITFGFCDILEEVYIPASVTDIENGIAIVEMCPNIIIVTPAGSRAEEVALEYELPVVNE